jgi:hypothetical protein
LTENPQRTCDICTYRANGPRGNIQTVKGNSQGVADTSMYEILELSRGATLAEIKSAYRRLAPQVHPDQGGSKALFRLVQEAYVTLTGNCVLADSSASPSTILSPGHVVSALATRTPVRDQRNKWVEALVALEPVVSSRICVTA